MKSNCCNAPIIENTDLCSRCKEHCEALKNKLKIKRLLKIQLKNRVRKHKHDKYVKSIKGRDND